ncbi:MAG: helix-turn-helix domain-containing protein [Oscillospiraceae bacterium]|nr:helix-turn-helix domain-containing protein [Oscillospiraceae bacterium]MDY5736526.1 helix-turn-helix domain-containing protein [Oscillospiraceae bacterium]
MGKPFFTPEELAEMAAFDAEVDAMPLAAEEIKESRERDRDAKNARLSARDYRAAEYRREYYERNKDAIAEYRRDYRERNKDAIAEYQRDYRERNKDAIAEYQRDYYERNKDAIAEYQRDYYERNKDAIAEYQRDYRERNKDAIAEYQRNRVDKNRNDNDVIRLGQRLRHIRKMCGLSQANLARITGLSQSSISTYETGATPMTDALIIWITQKEGELYGRDP